MSRSYKHTPRSGDTKDKYFKRYANRRLRRKPIDEIPLKNKSYRKDFCYYDICDYQDVGTTFEQYYASCVKRWHNWQHYSWHKDEPYPTREECWKEYQKWYKRK